MSDNIKDYINTRINDLRCEINVRFGSYEKSSDIYREGIDARLHSMNEIRETMRDQADKFITRDEIDLRLSERAKSNQVYISWALSFISMAIAVISILVRK